MNSHHNLTKSNIFGNVASPMQSKWHLQTEKVELSLYVVNSAALELQFAGKSYVSVIRLRFWAP